MNKKNIVIEGPIGVGKSTLSHKLADHFGYQLFLEQPAQNPFLARFYQSPEHFALPTQLFFLFQRVQQLADLKRQGERDKRLIADFMIDKDPIFAALTLSDDEMSLYQQVYDSLTIDHFAPDLVVYLQAPVKVLQQRIKKRNIDFELRMKDAYLDKLCDSYTEFFHHYSQSPLLIVNAAEINPIDNEQHFQALLTQIERVQAGKHFFNPLVD